MLHSFKRYWLVLTLLLAGSQSMFGFALLGPFNESFQTAAIGYNLSGVELDFGNDNGSADIGGPKNIGQGYRWNVPTVYYAERSDWITFFGPNGVAEVDKAFAVFNSLTNVSSYSPDLSEWPFDTRRVNFTAQALTLLDVKTVTMALMMEQLGLAQPDRYVYALRARVQPTGAVCPNFDYFIIQRNYDPVTQTFSPYVNNTLYGYVTAELCSFTPPPFGGLLADAVEYTADPTTANSAVAAFETLSGMYYTGLTRDDVGGLRYLYESNNIFSENGPNGSELEITNAPQLITSSNLALFLQQSLTLPEATLQAIYPNLVILSETNFFSNVVSTNVVFVLTNPPPQSIAGTPAVIVPVITLTTNFQQFFIHTFGNILITNAFAKGFVETNIITTGATPTAPFGFTGTTTSFTSRPTLVPMTNGAFFIIPTNFCGGFDIVAGPDITVTEVTNPVPIVPTTINGSTIVSESVITFSTNFTFVIEPITCSPPPTSGLREGIEKINFVRLDFDSFVGQAWGPVTNFYQQTFVTNGGAVPQTFRRVVTRPDILFTTGDNIVVGANTISLNEIVRTTPNFNTTLVVGGANGPFGPGTIEPGAGGGIDFSFINVGPIFENTGPSFVGNVNGGLNGNTLANLGFDAPTNLLFLWGSYDGTTNVPVVYPVTNNLATLAQAIFFQITTPSPLMYSLSQPFNVALQASGGSPLNPGGSPPQYLWPTNNLNLPPGLMLTTNGVLSGTIAGVTTNSLPVVISVQAEDAGQRLTQAQLRIVFVP